MVAGLQARNNARIVVSGSLAMFSDAFLAGNEAQQEFTKSVILWATKNSGVLRSTDMTHYRVGETDTPSYYTINEQIRFQIKIEELVAGEWVPFDQNDVQVDYHRLDPFVRRTMDNNNGIFRNGFSLTGYVTSPTTGIVTFWSVVPKPIKVPNSNSQIPMVFSNFASIIKRLNIPVLSWNLNCLFGHFDTINTRDSSHLPTLITSLHSQ